ncbi:MAG TPA: leucine-rich repeat domain-containing protein, partial [Anaerolineales bacterium]
MSGTIPPKLSNLKNLTILDLSNNKLNGNIPVELGFLTSLEYVYLANNQLSGNIPTTLEDLTNLRLLDLSENQLIGNIPSGIGKLTQLEFLKLSGNDLSGSIPAELANLSHLSELLLDNNHLSGSIPTGLGNLANLQYLVLSHNQLSGSIPSSVGNLKNLGRLDLYHNQLTGNIQPELINLPFWELDLSSNQLSGNIPAGIGNVGIDILWLQDNWLTGDIPDTLTTLTGICNYWEFGADCLNLDNNMLTVPAGYPILENPLHLFLQKRDPDWQLYQGFSQVIGAGGGEILSMDGRTDIQLPEGAVITDTAFTYKPWSMPQHSKGSLGFAHNSFDLTAMDTYSNPVMIFGSPITVTLSYTTTDLYGVPENTLGLYYWDDNSGIWKDGVATCAEGAYQSDLDGNTLQLPLC